MLYVIFAHDWFFLLRASLPMCTWKKCSISYTLCIFKNDWLISLTSETFCNTHDMSKESQSKYRSGVLDFNDKTNESHQNIDCYIDITCSSWKTSENICWDNDVDRIKNIFSSSIWFMWLFNTSFGSIKYFEVLYHTP
jgi:hypothetical protein